MKKIILCLLALSFICLNAKENLTIYNDNFAVVRSQFDIQLEKGVQNYLFDDIPSQIEATSLVFKSKDNKLKLFAQNYEYDLANSDAILRKYLNAQISIILKDNSEFSGILIFFDNQSIGLQDKSTKELYLLNKYELKNIRLKNLPENFYIKPTLNWQVNAPEKGKFPVDISYITRGLKWFVTYNAVLTGNTMELTPWVTLDNQSGKAYNDISLKLVAGDVNKMQPIQVRGGRSNTGMVMAKEDFAPPSFEEKQFADFRLYTLSQNVSVQDKQTKQMILFDPKTIDIEKIYDYNSMSAEVFSKVIFTNSKSKGLGEPLPKGIVKMYLKDTADNNLEFVGEDNVNHTSLDQKVELTMGKAFDVIAKSKVIKDTKIGNETEREMQITIENKKKEDIKVRILHNLYNGNYTITKKNFNYTEKDAYSIYIERNIKAGTTDNISWTQRVKNY
ncbi:MAG TPA: DUF4139 domain-containing protein [Candidatus Cloacimonadota bacterium]|nr:DUF4139 domain-containing protein [Candidatus Cloacimonadota bacterium]